MNSWKEAEAALEAQDAAPDADTEPTSEESAQESTDVPTSDVSASGSAGVTSSSDIDHVAELIANNPDSAREIIAQYKRNLDGQHGTAVSKLRQEMLQQAQALQQQINTQVAGVTTNALPSTEPDDLGLTQAEYDQLGKVLARTPLIQEQQKKQQAQNQAVLDQQAKQVIETMKSQYGSAMDVKTQNRLMRAIRMAGYDASNPDLVAEYNDIVEGLNDRSERTNGKIEEEKKTRTQASQRVNATSDRPLAQGGLRTDDIEVRDKKGRITDKSMMAAAQKFRQRLDRTGR